MKEGNAHCIAWGWARWSTEIGSGSIWRSMCTCRWDHRRDADECRRMQTKTEDVHVSQIGAVEIDAVPAVNRKTEKVVVGREERHRRRGDGETADESRWGGAQGDR